MKLNALRQLWSRKGDLLSSCPLETAAAVSIISADPSASHRPTLKNPTCLDPPLVQCVSSKALGKLCHLLQLYMIMALRAALLMRLRCFLRRRGEAGLNGA